MVNKARSRHRCPWTRDKIAPTIIVVSVNNFNGRPFPNQMSCVQYSAGRLVFSGWADDKVSSAIIVIPLHSFNSWPFPNVMSPWTSDKVSSAIIVIPVSNKPVSLRNSGSPHTCGDSQKTEQQLQEQFLVILRSQNITGVFTHSQCRLSFSNF